MRVTREDYKQDKSRINRVISKTKYYPSGVVRGYIKSRGSWGREKYADFLTEYAKRVYRHFIKIGQVKYAGYTPAHKDFFDNARREAIT